MDRELDVHFTLEIEQQLEHGQSLDDAKLAAHRAFGSVTLTREELRDMRTGAAIERLWQDVRYAMRLMRRSPGFTLVAGLTLTLAVAANSAIFSVVEGIILRPLSYRQPGQLVAIGQVNRSVVPPVVPVCAAHFAEWRRSSTSFDELALLEARSFTVGLSGEPERVSGAGVSANLFSMLGVTMQLGRTFSNDEDAVGRDRVVILTDDLWRRRFASDPRVIGQSILLDGTSYEVIGVLPKEFRFPLLSQVYAKVIFAQRERPQIWKPIAVPPQFLQPRAVFFNYAAIGRLKAGVTEAQALSELNVVQANLASLTPTRTQYPATITPLQEQITGSYRAGLVLIWAAVGAVLLISCINVANLLLARAARRRREMAVRSALGASRGRIARQMLVESLVLAATSGLAGLAGAYGLVRLIVAAAPGDLPRLDEVHLDVRVVLFTCAVALVDGVAFAVLPAWRSSKADPQDALRSDSRTSSAGREGVRLRGTLVSIEVAVCVMCLIVGGLLLRSFTHALNVHRGFDAGNVLTVELNLPNTRYSTVPVRTAFFRSALERASALPGVASVGLSNLLPLSGGTGPGNSFVVDEFPVPPTERPSARIRLVNGDFFRTMGIPLKQGRVFRDDDNPRVAIVSSLTANRAWHSEQIVGKQFRLGSETGPALDVIGVVGDVRATSLTTDPTFDIYLPYWTTAMPAFFPMSLALKAIDTIGTSRTVRSLLRELDPQLAAPVPRSMDEIVWGSLGQRRFQLTIVLLFAGAGLLLAALGVYGVVSYSVAQRTGEIGLRMALGADTTAIHALVTRQALLPLVPGLLVGIGGSLAIQQLVATLVFDVSPRDPLTIAAVCGLLTVVALSAAYFPARRATRISPVTALRYE